MAPLCLPLVALTPFVACVAGFAPLYQRHTGLPEAWRPNIPDKKSGPTSSTNPAASTLRSPLFHRPTDANNVQSDGRRDHIKGCLGFLKKSLKRLDTLDAAGIQDAKTAGVFGVLRKVTRIHDPITYMLLLLYMGYRANTCFRSMYFWAVFAFCIKWYRARYVFKIPVWDRQPNWNNVITSKDQEKELKALTCKNCGSTIFIAKSREFFFEGDTGLAGLGCFACGAKGKDNFVMDRDRIVEDVGDMDDYFEYERPLDFVTSAERRQLLKEAGGDEEKANRMLAEKEAAEAAANGDTKVESKDDPLDAQVKEKAKEIKAKADASMGENVQTEVSGKTTKKSKKKKKTSESKKTSPPPPPAPSSDDDMDILDMDEF